MKAFLAIGAASLALALTGCGGGGSGNNATANGAAPLPQIAAPNHGDWTQVVARTPDGGYLMGNPAAPVKLVEYGSITCPHCAHFAETSGDLRERYVRSGQVSYEFRPLMIHPQDPAVFMLIECQPPEAFFRLTDQLFSTQEEWLGRLQNVPQDQLQQLSNQSPLQQLGNIAQRASNELGITSTPSFIINGDKIDDTEWPAVEARLRAAIGG